MRTPLTEASISRRTLLAGSAAAVAGLGLAACDNGTANDVVTTMRVGALQGPTGMGLVGLMDAVDMLEDLAAAGGIELTEDSPVGKNPAEIGHLANSYEFTLAGSADELAPQLIQGDLDVLCVPANLAATLYQKTEGEVQVLCVNTLGVLDIVEAGEAIQTIADLAGRTIYSAGRGSTPQYALEYLLRENGIEPETDVQIQWASEHAECLAALQSDPSIVCMLPQPFATSALAQVEGARIALDLTEVWNETAQATGNDSQLITGVAVARREFVEDFPATVTEFLDAYAASVNFVNADPAAAAQLIEAAGIIKAQIAEKAIPYCNIVCMTGAEMREGLEGYLETLYEADAKAVGGSMPEDDFYYEA